MCERPKGSKSVSHVNSGKKHSNQRVCQCKGPEAEAHLYHDKVTRPGWLEQRKDRRLGEMDIQ